MNPWVVTGFAGGAVGITLGLFYARWWIENVLVPEPVRKRRRGEL